MSLATEQTFVTSLYQNVLFHSPSDIASASTQSSINSWATMINTGQLTESQATTDFADSAEASENVLPVISLYEGLFKRVPEAGAIAFYVAALDRGTSLNTIAQYFFDSPEFSALYGAHPTPTTFVTDLYQNVLGRIPDQAGLAFYLNILGGAAATPSIAAMAGVLLDFTRSFEALSDSTLNNENWLIAGANGTYPSTIPAAPATYTLTNGGAASATEGSVVTFHLATANVVAGTVLTYSLTGVTASEVVGNQLTGTATVGTNGATDISVTLNSATGEGLTGPLAATLSVPAGASASSVTTASVTLVETAGNTLIIPGAGGVAITASTAVTGGVIVGNAAGLNEPSGAITITDTAATGTVTIYGGAGVTATTFSTGGVIIGGGTLATDPTGAITVTDNAATGTVLTYGGVGVTVSTASTGGVTVGTVTGTAEPTGAVTITDTAAAGLLTVYGGAAVVITSSSISPITIGVAGTVAADPVGNITVTNLITDPITHAVTFGTGPATIFANGGNSATITGTTGDTITDVSTTWLLANVTLDGVGGATSIHTGNALISLTVLDGAANSSQTITEGAGHVLALAVGSSTSTPAFANVIDATATSVNVSATGTTVETLTLSVASATTIILGAHTGTDSVRVGVVLAAATTAGTVITGAVTGDFIRFADTATSVVTLGAVAGTLAAAIASVDAAVTTIAHSATIFQNGGNSYILESVGAGSGTLHAGDSLIELVGTHTIGSPAGGIFQLMS